MLRRMFPTVQSFLCASIGDLGFRPLVPVGVVLAYPVRIRRLYVVLAEIELNCGASKRRVVLRAVCFSNLNIELLYYLYTRYD